MTHHILIIEDERDCAQHRRLASAARLRGGLEQGRRCERIDQRQGQQLVIDFVTSPSKYRHWKLQFAGEVAELIMDVDENAGLFEGYQLKLTLCSDRASSIPRSRPLILKSGKDRVSCADANLRMLAGSQHSHKVNFCGTGSEG